MKINISDIRVKERIRKEVTKIEELAADIRQNGLISPIAVMPVDEGTFQLLAGLRRLKAVQELGWTDVEANVVSPKGAEEILRIEISENEQREPFTFSERDYFRKLLEEIEHAKAKERMSQGGKGGLEQGSPHGDTLQRGRVSSIIAEKLGMKKTTYDRSKYISAHATPEDIDLLDRNERSIHKTYDEIKSRERVKAVNSAVPTTPIAIAKYEPPQKPKLSDREKEERAMAMLSPKEREAVERNNAFAAMSPDEKIIDLQRQLREERCRAVTAETELERLKVELHNATMHRDGTIHSLENQLENAYARIAELEVKYESD
ncbi:hypothetical protein FACS18949_06360 [Clostridia bacterium]|nr:hypothetical protein FACS18949_06360 [Clostridia bacterium]